MTNRLFHFALAGAVLILSSCGVSSAMDATRQVPPKLDAMLKKLQGTQDAIHKQTLKDAEAKMLEPENTEFLNPPIRMMVGGKIFAEEATAEDLLQFSFINLKDLEEVKPDDTKRGADGKYPPDVILKYDHEKSVLLSKLSVIVGLAPQETVEEMVTIARTRLENGNRFLGTLFTILYLRASFIQLTCIGADIFEGGLKYPGGYYDAIKYINSIEYITNLPFKDKIKIKVTGFLDPALNYEEGLETVTVKALWKRLDRGLRDELDPDWVAYAPAIKGIVAKHVAPPHAVP